MPNIFHQSIEDILKTATPEQRILWNHVFLNFGERCSISQLIIQGAAGELGTYVARKMFLAYQINFSGVSHAAGTGKYATFYDENNLAIFVASKYDAYWDATAAAARVAANDTYIKNMLFSRVFITAGYLNFIGFRITY